MLPKQYRLPLRTELKRVKVTGRLIHGRFFSLLVALQSPVTSNTPPVARFGFIISSKVHKRATKRNRAKRLLSEAVYSLIPKTKSGFEGVFLAKKAIIGKELVEVKKEVEEIFRKGKLIV